VSSTSPALDAIALGELAFTLWLWMEVDLTFGLRLWTCTCLWTER
jgi:hypothetical protein